MMHYSVIYSTVQSNAQSIVHVTVAAALQSFILEATMILLYGINYSAVYMIHFVMLVKSLVVQFNTA
jgi:hypothetical protein